MVKRTTRPRIALLVAGGGAVGVSRRLRGGLRTAADLRPWLQQLGELEMLAEVEARLVVPDGRPLTTADWPKLAQAVAAVPAAMAGVVLLVEEQSAPVVAVMIQAVVQSTGRPVICLGAGSAGEPAARSALINAVQSASAPNLAGVFFLTGGRLLRAGTVRVGDDGRVSGTEVGKVDFGLRLAVPTRRAATWKVWTKLNDRVAIWPASYLTMTTLPPKSSALAGVVIVSEPWRPLRPADYARCRMLLPAGTAIVISGPVDSRSWPDDVPRVTDPPMVAAVWLMVALGHGQSWRHAWKKLSQETHS